MKFFTMLGKIQLIRFYGGLLLVGLLFTVFGTLILVQPEAETAEVTATIDRIEYEMLNGEPDYHTYVSYTDANGIRHENKDIGYSSTWAKGDRITVYYDVNDPENVSTGSSKLIAVIFTFIGVLCVGISLLNIVRSIRANRKDMNPFDQVDMTAADEQTVAEIRDSNEATSDYYFHFTGKLNQSYIMETAVGRRPVYEAVCDKIGVLQPYRFTFVNHITGTSFKQIVTHTTTMRYGSENGALSFSIPTNSAFQIGKENNWQYLGKLGYALEPHLNGIRLTFDVLHYGVKVAYIETAGTNILKDGATNPLGEKLPAQGLYKITCRESDIEGIFFACFSAARVEFF